MISTIATKLMEFFEEDNGRASNTRLNSTVMIWCACFILVAGSFKFNGVSLDANSIGAALGLIAAGAGQKLIQKNQEVKGDAPNPPSV